MNLHLKIFMKLSLLALSFLLSSIMFAQDIQFTVSVQKQTITVLVDDDNSDKILEINLQQPFEKGDELIVKNNMWKEERDWKRNFIIFDEEDNEAAKITETKTAGLYCISPNDLKKNLEPGKKYFLYTTALPKDPQKAMEVKVRRQLVCVIEVR